MSRRCRRLWPRTLHGLFLLAAGCFTLTVLNLSFGVPSSCQEMNSAKNPKPLVTDTHREGRLAFDAQEAQRQENPGKRQIRLNTRWPEDRREMFKKLTASLETTRPTKVPSSGANVFPERTHCVARNSHVFPLCQMKFKEFNATWNEKCHRDKFGVNASDPCSVLVYLSEVERWCPLLPWRRKAFSEEKRPLNEKADLRRNISGLLELFSPDKFRWLRERSVALWPEWMDALDSLSAKQTLAGRRKKSILVYMGSLVVNPFIFEEAFTGGPQGELVQWSDVITSLYVLGHDLVITADESEITRNNEPLVSHPESACATPSLSKVYDAIFTDIPGTTTIRYHTGPNFSRYKCKLRILDTFGTEAEFNYKFYKPEVRGGRSIWANLNMHLQQFMTMYPHTPDNLFIGFAVPRGTARNQTRPSTERNWGLVYGKRPSYFNGKKHYLDIFHKFMDIHSNFGEDTLSFDVPGYVINHGIVNSDKFTSLLRRTKVFIGLGFPFEGPAPLDAIANGCFYINPKLKKPLNRENELFFKEKPTFRKLYSQNPYAQDFIGKPFVHTINMDNDTEVEEAIRDILRSQETPYLPHEFTHEGMLQRVNAFVENLEFCSDHQWPPLAELLTVVSETGDSCKDTCYNKGLLCEPSFFRHLNTADVLKNTGMDCASTVVMETLLAPSLNETNNSCLLQEQPLLFSCVASHYHVTRLCPCRRFQKEQVALCPSCT